MVRNADIPSHSNWKFNCKNCWKGGKNSLVILLLSIIGNIWNINRSQITEQ